MPKHISTYLDLNSLTSEELIKQLHCDLYDGFVEETVECTRALLSRGWHARDVIEKALVSGMDLVGVDFKNDVLFVPEVLKASKAMQAGMAVVRPLLIDGQTQSAGRVVIGTVKGDIHEIGKNLVAMMMEGAGFEVIDLGTDQSVDDFIRALEVHKPDVLGMSALFTTCMPYMKVVIDEMRKRDLRDNCIVLVGGAPLSESFARDIGADAYCADAGVAVDMARNLMNAQKNK